VPTVITGRAIVTLTGYASLEAALEAALDVLMNDPGFCGSTLSAVPELWIFGHILVIQYNIVCAATAVGNLSNYG
jgi:hypothetical protein